MNGTKTYSRNELLDVAFGSLIYVQKKYRKTQVGYLIATVGNIFFHKYVPESRIGMHFICPPPPTR